MSRYEYHDRCEQKPREEDECGEPFYVVNVITAVANSSDPEDIDLVYHAVKHAFQVVGQDGPAWAGAPCFGDQCYRGVSGIGFVRGNVVVEVWIKAYHWTDGRIRPGGVTLEELRAKEIEFARRIDDLLLERMFTPAVRERIRAAENERRAKTNTDQD